MRADSIGWDWSYMANEDENHALVVDDVVPIEFALMAMSSSSSSSDKEELKKEKESIDHKLAGFGNASKDLNDLLESQKSAKDKTGLPKFVDDTVTDYTRPTPSIDVLKDVSDEHMAIWKSNSTSFSEQGGSVGNVVSKPMI
ncbi:hypothetical protein Tco_1222279, partial [Tanacetum coccineum]